jgi:trehalose 6-phosphate phosphatase
VAVITAREESAARRLVGVDQVTYVGNYALPEEAQASADIERAKTLLRPALADIPCVELEEKGATFALHFRNCPEEGVRTRLLELVAPIATSTGVRIIEGKQVLELAPNDLPDKGKALSRLAGERGMRGLVFMGDDLSDTAIFREISRRRMEEGLPGLAIAVIDDETEALVREMADEELRGVDEVEEFLDRLAGLIVKETEA